MSARLLLASLATVSLLLTGCKEEVKPTIQMPAAPPRPDVVVLHSYEIDYPWDRSLDEATRSVFARHGNPKAEFQYMNLKNQPDKKNEVIQAQIKKLQANLPKVIIGYDDDAQQVLKAFANNPGVQLVFSGVNGNPEDYGYDKATNATGVLERVPLEGFKQVVIDLVKFNSGSDKPRVLLIGDKSKTVELIRAYLTTNFDWGPVQIVDNVATSSYEDWQKAITGAKGKADIIVTMNYRELFAAGSQTPVAASDVIDWLNKNNTVPVIGTGSYYVPDGGMLAITVSPEEHGKVAAERAVTLLKGDKKASDLGIQANKRFLVQMRPKQLDSIGFKLPYAYHILAEQTGTRVE